MYQIKKKKKKEKKKKEKKKEKRRKAEKNQISSTFVKNSLQIVLEDFPFIHH